MSNTFMDGLNSATNFEYTTNGALAHKSTNSKVYDMFAMGGAYRNRSVEDCILLFANAYAEDPSLALKCLFYLRDCRGGQGERRFFRVCYKWLAQRHSTHAAKVLDQIPTFGRWDDLLYSTVDTPLFNKTLVLIKKQLALDLTSTTPSLLGKWMPSINAHSTTTIQMGKKIRNYLHVSDKEYRKMLSTLRKRINIVERLMSENRWDEIEFDKIPSKAGLIYRNAFARRDILTKKYEAFMKDESTKVNADALYPYEVVRKATHLIYADKTKRDIERKVLEKYWTNLPDYFEGKPASIMCVVDTSGSMTSTSTNVAPIDVAISLGMYCAERIGGPFKDHYISFASRPQLIKVEGVDFYDKVRRIYKTNLCDSTNLLGTFNLLKQIALRPDVKEEDIPKTIVVISDMQIDQGSSGWSWRCGYRGWTAKTAATEMEQLRKEWKAAGLTLPRLVYWNVHAVGKANILDASPDVSFVSGCSPVIFKSVMTGKNGYDLMLDVLNNSRYSTIK